MKKMFLPPPLRKERSTLKIFLVMRLTLFLCLFSVLGVYASSYSQNTRFNLNYKNTSIKQILNDITKQSEFEFFYSNDDFDSNSKVNLTIKNGTVKDILDRLIVGGNMQYRVVDKIVVISPANSKKVSEAPQGKTVSGVVTDVSGAPLAGVTVMVKGKSSGTATDIDGKYTLNDVPAKATLLFSFVGMKTQTIAYSGQPKVNVIMTDSNIGLEAVQVVGYGTQKKMAVTGAVNTVNSKEIMQSTSPNLMNALSGRMSGLISVQSSGGQPGMEDASFYLRGAGTLNGTYPLILIDGVYRYTISTLDASEVESVSILKDASATAVFGVRGANGVILITTKRGAEGKAELNLNFTQSYASFTREPERRTSLEYMDLRNQALQNDGLGIKYTDAIIAKYQNPLAGLDPNDPDYATKAKIRQYMYPNNDYYREFIRRYAPQTRLNVSVSGGTKKANYFVDAGYIHQGGNLNTEPKSVLGYDPACKMDRFTFRTNLDYKITNSLSSFLNLGTYIEQVNMPYVGGMYGGDRGWMISDLIYQAISVTPVTPGPTTIGGFGVAPGQIVDPGYLDRSAFEIMNRRGFLKDVRTNLNSSFGMNWDMSKAVTKGLSMKGMISFDSYAGSTLEGGKYERLYLTNINYDTDEMSYSTKRAEEGLLSIGRSAWTYYNINLQGSVNYNRKFGKHEVGGMLLAQRDFWDHDAEIPHNVIGLSGRTTYNYDNKYFAEFDMGYNGSEQFAPSTRFGFFPAVSASWVVSNEKFLKDNSILTSLKFRASTGKVGSDRLGGYRFLYLDNISLGGGNLQSLGNSQKVNLGLIGNPDLHWEVAQKENFGVDFQFFKDLSGSFDLYKEHRTSILIDRGTVPQFQGVDSGSIPKANMGIVDNRGYEFDLTYNKSVTKDLSIMLKGNMGYNHNICRYADEVQKDDSYMMRYWSTGYSIGQQRGYKIDWKSNGGYWISEDEIKSSGLTYGFGSPRVGDFKYIDMNNDGVINDKDIVPIGYSYIPRITWGASFSANYKGFDFTIFFQGIGKFSGTYGSNGVYENKCQGTYYDYHMHAWTLDRYLKGEKITYPALSTVNTTNHVANDFFVMSRAFTRLKNMELGYTLPKSGLKALGINKLRVFVGGQNLYTWDNLRMGNLDPEYDNSIGYPITKTLNFGLNVTF